jgi:hypothetical protein
MKNRVLAAIILLGPFALLLFFLFHPGAIKTPETGPGQSPQDNAVSNALAQVSPRVTALIASNFAAPPRSVYYSTSASPAVVPAGKPAPLEFTNIPPEIVLENVRHAIHGFGAMFGGNPVGVNAEITGQLMGNNPKHINFLNREAGLRVNAGGELVDPWGTPYFFHQLSGTDMEIHSAGPDRIMWTADDLVISE